MKTAIKIGDLYMIIHQEEATLGFWYRFGNYFGNIYRVLISASNRNTLKKKNINHLFVNWDKDYSDLEIPAVYRKWRRQS